MSNGGNNTLQARAGRNSVPYRDWIQGIGTIVNSHLEANELVLLKGSDDLQEVLIGPIAQFLDILGDYALGTAPFVRLENTTGADISAELWLVDRFGGETKAEESGVISDSSYYEFEGGPPFPLSKGDKLVLRVTGNVTAGSGVEIQGLALQATPNLFRRLEVGHKITGPVEYESKGEQPFTNILSVSNVSPNDVTATVKITLPNGSIFEYTQTLYAYSADAISLSGAGKARVTFDGPSEGYLYGSLCTFMPMNSIASRFFPGV